MDEPVNIPALVCVSNGKTQSLLFKRSYGLGRFSSRQWRDANTRADLSKEEQRKPSGGLNLNRRVAKKIP